MEGHHPPISLGNLWKSVQLNPHARIPLSSETCSFGGGGSGGVVILSVILILYTQGNYFLNFRYVLKFLVSHNSGWDFCSQNLLQVPCISGIHQISFFCTIWPYELSLLIISMLRLTPFSSSCIRASYGRNSSVGLNSYSLGIVSLEDLQHWVLNQTLVFCPSSALLFWALQNVNLKYVLKNMFSEWLANYHVLLWAINLFYKKVECQKYKIIQGY